MDDIYLSEDVREVGVEVVKIVANRCEEQIQIEIIRYRFF
jgi:hypothetical protein